MTTFNIQQTAPLALSASLKVVPPVLSYRLLASAENLAKGLRPLLAADGCAPAFLFLCGQVLESALKAILAKGSFNEDGDRIKQEFGHRIPKAWRAALNECPAIQPMPVCVKHLACLHQTFGLRYGYEKLVLLVFDRRHELLGVVDEVLRQARGRVLTP